MYRKGVIVMTVHPLTPTPSNQGRVELLILFIGMEVGLGLVN